MDSNEVRRQWAERSGEYSPEYYAYYGPDERSETILHHLDRFVDRGARVLELGCSSGRHLAHLFDNGFENLVGVELNGDAFDVMAETYPELYATGTFHHDAIENVVREFEDDAFDAVYSVETLQHLHPDVAWVFDDLARVTADLLVTVENEGDGDPRASDPEVNYVREDVPLYYRDWSRIFTDRGFVEVDAVDDGRDTARVFRAT
ncbi:MAG: class I SAM-dependent methyltransferase [Haloferacaceae archaeon]